MKLVDKNELTQEQLKAKLHYDAETGLFTHLTSNGVVKGSVAGRLNAKGYRVIGLYGQEYLAHRLAFLYMNGEWPGNEVDHKDLVKDNSRWSNLEDATSLGNKKNRNPNKNVSPYGVGISLNRVGNYEACVRCDGKKHTKTFKTNIEALDWTISKYQELGFSFNHYKHNVYVLYKLELAEANNEAA